MSVLPEIPPVPPKAALPNLSLVKGTRPEHVNTLEIARQWVERFNERCRRKDFADLSQLFHEECWWRDFLTLSWDLRSIKGMPKLNKFLQHSDHDLQALQLSDAAMLAPRLMDMGGRFVSVGFHFRTKFGTGRGFVFLVNTGLSEWKAWIVHTMLEELHNNSKAAQAPSSQSNDHISNGPTNGSTYDHTVVIVGGGQCGVMLAARLRARNIDYVVLDMQPEFGGSWNTRYDVVTAHTPSYCDPFPFEPYPEDYPLYASRNTMRDWMRSYARKLDLNVRHNAKVESVTRSKGLWTVTFIDTISNQITTLTCRHVALATGIFAAHIPRPLTFQSQSRFEGTIYHTKKHTTPPAMIPSNLSISSARIAIIGTGTSAHDMAADYVSHGAKSVTMIQRGPIFSMSRATLEKTFWAAWDPALGENANDADIFTNAMPSPVARSLGVGMSQAMSAMDKEMLDGLAAKGLKLKRGEDGDAFADWLYVKTGSFYIDQGANQMILDGKIKVKDAGDEGVVDIDERGLILGGKDGQREVFEADVVVVASGFRWTDALVDELVPDKEERTKLGAVGHFDEEGERIGWWRPSGIAGFWYMTGAIMWGRWGSNVIALQIDALERGLNPEYWKQ